MWDITLGNRVVSFCIISSGSIHINNAFIGLSNGRFLVFSSHSVLLNKKKSEPLKIQPYFWPNWQHFQVSWQGSGQANPWKTNNPLESLQTFKLTVSVGISFNCCTVPTSLLPSESSGWAVPQKPAFCSSTADTIYSYDYSLHINRHISTSSYTKAL